MEQMKWLSQGSGDVAKSSESGRRRDAAVVGASGTALGLGTVASGVPGYKPKWTGGGVQGPAKEATLGRKIPAGIFGARVAGHEKTLQDFVDNRDYDNWKNTPASKKNMFARGRTAGKAQPEVDVLRQLKAGRKAGHVAQAVGATGLAAVGAKHMYDKRRNGVAKADERRRSVAPEAAMGGGLAAAGIGYGGAAPLAAAGKEWGRRAKQGQAKLDKIMPEFKADGAGGDNLGTRGTGQWSRKRSHRQMHRMGALQGDITQAKYFERAYAANVKGMRKLGAAGLGVAGAGAVGAGVRRYRQDHGVAKADWRNIEQSKTDAREGRRTARQGGLLTSGAGAAAGLGAAFTGKSVQDLRSGRTVGIAFGDVDQNLDGNRPFRDQVSRKGPLFRVKSKPQGVYGIAGPTDKATGVFQPRLAMSRNAAIGAGVIGAAGATGLGMMAYGRGKERRANANIRRRRREIFQSKQRDSRYDDIDYRVARGLASPER